MICPKCKAEYREGFYECADCSVALVEINSQVFTEENDVQDDINENSETDFIEIWQTSDFLKLGLLKSLFDAENIHYTSFGEVGMTRTLMTGGAPARVFVAKHNLDRAYELLKSIM